ncbi:YdcF family protein [Lutibacter sp. B2]|nr:YdcF family protein [Lutibacter sp. B2]
MRKFKKVVIFLSVIGLIVAGTVLLVDYDVKKEGSKYIVSSEDAPNADAILVLGAYVMPSGTVSPILGDRLKVGLELYDKNKSNKVLVSGDHGQVEYDEVNAMKQYLKDNDVKSENVFMDHAGFSTYESIYRAKDIFKVKKVIIVTQKYHLMRAVYIARKMGLDAYGVASDKHMYRNIFQYSVRETAARCKDYLFVNILKPKPTYLGETIPITGDGTVTDDK